MRGEGRSWCIGSGGLKGAAFVLVPVLGAIFRPCSTDKPVVFATDHDVRTKEGFDRNDT